MPEAISDPSEEFHLVVTHAVKSKLVEVVVFHKYFLWVLEVEQSIKHNGKTCHCNVIHLIDKWLVKRLTREGTPKAEVILS